MTDEETFKALASLIKDARARTGEDRTAAAKRIQVNYGTLSDIENAMRWPSRATLRAIELGFGWRTGSLSEMWSQRHKLSPGEITLDILEDPHALPMGTGTQPLLRPLVPVSRASELSDQELMAELSFRFLMRDSRNGGENE